METWEYLYQFGKPITQTQLKLRKINGDKCKGNPSSLISEKEYVLKYKPEYEKKMAIATMAGKIYKKIPWIKAMVVTGSVASEYPKEQDDVDIMFICQKHSIWLCRLLVYMISLVLRYKIRRDAFMVKDHLCLNLWIEEDYRLPGNKQNLKNAMDAILAKVIFGESVYIDFLVKNSWVDKYVSFGYKERVKKSKKVGDLKLNKLVVIINLVVYWAMRLYMKKKGKEIVDLHKAFFHP